VVNRLLPIDPGAYFAAWQEAQQRYLPMVEESFAPVPVRTVPFFDREVVGLEMLDRLASALFADEDPAQAFYRGHPYRVDRNGSGYTLAIELPFVEKSDVSLSRNADELTVHVGAFRRNLILPRILVTAPTEGATFEDRTLKIQFGMPRATLGGTT